VYTVVVVDMDIAKSFYYIGYVVSKAVTESMVMSLKLLPCTIFIARTESADGGLVMICCAASPQLQQIKKTIEKILMVNFKRKVAVFVQTVIWVFYFITE
jgi:hypothetical protein